MILSTNEIDVLILDAKLQNRLSYNIGDRLNAPYYRVGWPRDGSRCNLGIGYSIARLAPESILGRYFSKRPEDEPMPNADRLREATRDFGGDNPQLQDMVQTVQQPGTLVVHVRSGDMGVISAYYRSRIIQLSKNFDKTILFCGVHANESYRPHDESKRHLCDSVNGLCAENPTISYYLNSPDAHIYLMSRASHLLLHKMGFSIIASLVATGRLYITREFSLKNFDAWKEDIQVPFSLVDG